MKRIIILIGLLSCFFIGCNKEKDLKPSGLDVERLYDSLDLARPFVRDYYENYGVYILHRFDETSDLKYDFHDVNSRKFWDGLILTKITRETALDSIMEILENDVLSCFKSEFQFNGETYHSDFLKKYFPTKVLLVENLVSEWGASGSIPTESVNRASESLQGIIHGAINNNGVVMNLNTKVMCSSESNFQKYRRDILYFMLAFIIDKFNLYEQISERFYDYSSTYYNKNIAELLADAGESVNPETGDTIRYITKSDFVRKYGVLANSIYPTTSNKIIVNRNIANKERDLRLYLDQLLTPELLANEEHETWKLTAITKRKMWYVGHLLLDLGIDVSVLNSDPEFLNLLKLKENELINIE